MQEISLYIQVVTQIMNQFGVRNIQELETAYSTNKAEYDTYFQGVIKDNVLGTFGNSPEATATFGKILEQLNPTVSEVTKEIIPTEITQTAVTRTK